MSSAPAATYLLGVATCDVTPPVGTMLSGFGSRRTPSTGCYLPLRGSVTALTDNVTGGTVLIVSVEWIGFYNRTAGVRALIAAATGVPSDHILLLGTHTHCGPAVTRGVEGDSWEDTDETFLAAAFARLAETAQAALAGREPVTLHSTTGWCGFAYSRRKPDGKGGITWAPTLDAPHDHSVPLLRCDDADGKVRQLIFGYACHPTSSGPILEIGGDYPGFARTELEKTLDGPATFLLGCAGDQKPWRPVPGEATFPCYPVPAIAELGRDLAGAVQRELKFGRWQTVTGSLRMRTRTMELHTRVLPRADYEAMLGSENIFFDRWARLNLAHLDRGEQPPAALPFEIQTVSLGESWVLIAMAGEINVEYGLRLQKELGGRFAQVWPVGYANDILGYVPAERQIPEGGYEVIGCNMYMGRTGPMEPGTEDRIVAAVREMLAD
jgi:hypothetical protein